MKNGIHSFVCRFLVIAVQRRWERRRLACGKTAARFSQTSRLRPSQSLDTVHRERGRCAVAVCFTFYVGLSCGENQGYATVLGCGTHRIRDECVPEHRTRDECVPPAPLAVMSPEAQAVMDAGRELWRYYHQQPDANADASYYDIRRYFQGTEKSSSFKTDSEQLLPLQTDTEQLLLEID